MRYSYSIFILLLTIFSPISTYSIYSYPFDTPSFQLKEINTENFRIIYSDSSKEKAFEIAQFAEEEFDSLIDYYGEFLLLKYFPNQKIRVIVSSDYQLANASASLFIYPTITIYSSVPPALSDTHSYTEPQYLKTFFRHELAHIITIAIRKYFDNNPVINIINRAVVPAAIFSSRSFLEGSAIARESDGSYGRLKDPYTYHLARRTLLDNQFPSFAEFGGAQTKIDTRAYPYTYGALFNQYLDNTIGTNMDANYWDQVGQWRISSWALKNISQQKQKDLWIGFRDSLYPQEEYTINTNTLLLPKDRRINSFQRIKDKLYYFNQYNKELRMYDLINKKDKLIVYGGSAWQKVSVSPDEQYLLISGIAKKKQFVIVVKKRSLLPISKAYEGFNEASFLSDSTTNNIQFVAINRNTTYPELTIISNDIIIPLYQGSSTEILDNPVSVDSQYIYFLHSLEGNRVISRIDRETQIISSLQSATLSFPRFLVGDTSGISISYAEEGNNFYKRAIIQDNNLYLITNNIKGELFDSTIHNGELYYRSSFAKQDNIMNMSTNQLAVQTQTATFTPHTPRSPIEYTYEGEIIKYNQSLDLYPMLWIPFVSEKKAGISTLLQDSTGANLISIGLNIEYDKATPEFSFSWNNEELPIEFDMSFNNLYLTRSSIFQLGQHHLISTGMRALYNTVSQRSLGNLLLSLGINWQGRFTGDPNNHPYTWNSLMQQQVIGTTLFTWQYFVSEGKWGFYRMIELTLQNKVDFLNTSWYRIEGKLRFSPPILPIQIDFYASYDTSLLSIFGVSSLGSSLIPIFKEYQQYALFSTLVFYGQINLLLYSWEIHKGAGFGELFFDRWAFKTGYKGGYWGPQNPYLHSVYLSSNLDFSLLYGNLSFSFNLAGTYAITTKEWGYEYGLSVNLPI